MDVETYLREHSVLDGHGNLDGEFVPLPIAWLAVQMHSEGKLELLPRSWVRDDHVGSLSVIAAGVDPNHQTDHCDHCGYVFAEKDDEIIPTCTHTLSM